MKAPQEAIVLHSIAICGQIFQSIYLRGAISCLCSLFLIKKENKTWSSCICRRAFPLRCDSVTLWLSPRHSCPPVIIPLLHTHFLQSLIIPMSLLCQVHYLSAVSVSLSVKWLCKASDRCTYTDDSKWCFSEAQSSHFWFEVRTSCVHVQNISLMMFLLKSQ